MPSPRRRACSSPPASHAARCLRPRPRRCPNGTIVDAGTRRFATLALFARPLALGAAIDRLEREGRSSTDFAATLNVINMLVDEGALVQPIEGWPAGSAARWYRKDL